MKLRRIEMRNWCAALVMSALLALPLCAQQKSTGAGDETTSAAPKAEKHATSSNAAPSSKPVAAKNVFALPATPRPTPFPGGTPPERKDTRPPGRLVPRYEIAGMYSYINFAPGDPFSGFDSHGGSGSFTFNASKWLGLTGELGGYQFQRNLSPLTGSNASVNGGLMTYLFGPRLNLRKFDHFVPFVEFLAGGVRADTVLASPSQNSFAIATGGGLDIVLTKNLSWRFAQLDYF